MRFPELAHRAGAWLMGVAAVEILAGPVTGAIWAAVAVWHLLRPPPPRVLLVASTALLALVPVAWVVGNAGRLGQVSADLVLADRAPATLASVALALLVTGVWRDVVGAPTAAPSVAVHAENAENAENVSPAVVEAADEEEVA